MGEKLDLIDFEGGAKVAGHGFYFLKNDAVLLELALQRYALDARSREGFTPTITPDLARNEVLEGIGFIPAAARDADLQRRRHRPEPGGHGRNHAGRDAPGEFSSRAAAAEVRRPVALLPHRGRRPRPAERAACTASTSSPRSRCSPSRCPSRATTCSTISASSEGRIFHGLGIPYHVIDTCTGDLGGAAYRPRSLDARPRRGRRIRRSDQHVELHRLPGRGGWASAIA